MRKLTTKFEMKPGYQGSRFSLIFLVLLTSITTLRSLAHVFLPDGGANSIAGLDVSVAGGSNLIAMFAQWGYTQLLLSVMMWGILIFARSLVPFALLVQTLDWGGRILVGQMKPIEVASPPPGEIGSYILLPLCLIALWSSLPKKP
ncbi:hypothetical protein HRU87_06240 [Aquiluna borgnonia]|uniref:Uncharacterized protein n=1 Tax=Aquiluna borgnonia TaxID=2499157 RepID=A0A7D4U876_9MICO|nr:hypothetical protein [Aquiluna borgnonia]QKJ25756.1 hypothetical protein HRU87_06240 [Aquiluna borgnonia]